MTNLNEIENDKMRMCIGRTIEAWSIIESQFCHIFCKLSQMHPPLGRKIFYSNAGFGSRIKLINTALKMVNIQEVGMKDFINDAAGKAEGYSRYRNMIVHGDMYFVSYASSQYNGSAIIVQGKEFWNENMNPDYILTISQVSKIDANFRRLGHLLLLSINWDGKTTESSPSKLREGIVVLPNKATEEVSISEWQRVIPKTGQLNVYR